MYSQKLERPCEGRHLGYKSGHSIINKIGTLFFLDFERNLLQLSLNGYLPFSQKNKTSKRHCV